MTIKNSEAYNNIMEILRPQTTSKLRRGHYYLFHTQFDAFFCSVGRVTVNPFAIAKYANNFSDSYGNMLLFLRTNNRLPGCARDAISENPSEYVCDITEVVESNGLEAVVSYLDSLHNQYNNISEKDSEHANYDME